MYTVRTFFPYRPSNICNQCLVYKRLNTELKTLCWVNFVVVNRMLSIDNVNFVALHPFSVCGKFEEISQKTWAFPDNYPQDMNTLLLLRAKPKVIKIVDYNAFRFIMYILHVGLCKDNG